MPNYSKTKIRDIKQQSIDNIAWHELHEIWLESLEDCTSQLQQKYDLQYQKDLDEAYKNYADTHEAPYEGNFSDSMKCPKANPGPTTVFKFAQKRIEERVKQLQIPANIDWIMPQLITLIGGMTFTRNNHNNKISGLRFRNDNFTNPKLKGIYWFLMINNRSTYLQYQYKPPHRSYGALVPLVMYAVRLVQGRAYSEWDPDEIHYVVNSDLADAITYGKTTFTRAEIIKYRQLGLTTAETKTLKNPLTTAKLTGPEIKNSDFGKLPSLAQVMLSQIWCAHPQNRTNYMILTPNPENWDNMPPALIDTDILAPVEKLSDILEQAKTNTDNWGR